MDGAGSDRRARVGGRATSRRRCPFCYTEVGDGADPVVSTAPCWPGRYPTRVGQLGRYCPACARELPAGWESVTTTCLTVVAYRAGGTQTYLGVMGRLLFLWGRAHGLTVTGYDRPFSDSLTGLGTSDQELNPHHGGPIVMPQWVLRFHQLGRTDDHVLVVGYVMAEDLPRGISSERDTRISDADGLILLIDAADLPVVRSGLGVGDVPGRGPDPASLWFAVAAQLQQDLGRPAAHPPRAVTIAKFDLIQQAATKPDSILCAALAGNGLRFHHDPGLQDQEWNSCDADLLDAELRSLCSQYLGLSALVSAAQSAQRDGDEVRFFAVSSLGRTPEDGRTACAGTRSYRCLDPVKWFLMQSDLIEAG